MPESPYPMIPIETALDIVFKEIKPLPLRQMPFAQALGLVLAEDVLAPEFMPRFPLHQSMAMLLLPMMKTPAKLWVTKWPVMWLALNYNQVRRLV